MGIKRRLSTDNYAACCKQDKQPGHVDVPFGHKIEIPARMRGSRRCLALNLPHLRHTAAASEEGTTAAATSAGRWKRQQHTNLYGRRACWNYAIKLVSTAHAAAAAEATTTGAANVAARMLWFCVPATSVALQRQFVCNVQSKMLLGVNLMRATAAAATRAATSRKVAAATATSL